MLIEYEHNNSGGWWWLKDEHWKALEAAGWVVNWEPERFLGALAETATREGLTKDEAIAEWERVTGMDSEAKGCSCCGAPHYFSLVR